MQSYFGAAGAGCLLYYGLIVFFTRKWNSTFTPFWPLCGGVHIGVCFFFPLLPEGVKLAVGAGLLVCWTTAFAVGGCILSAMRQKDGGEAAYLIILGAQVRGTWITNSLMRRLDGGYAYLKDHPETKVIVSGGQGKGEAVSEASAMAENLLFRGLEAQRIIQEDRSTSTWENLCFSAEYIGNLDIPAVVVTNNFHLYRALLLGKQIGYTNLSGIAVSSSPVLFLNYLVREIFAVVLTKIKSVKSDFFRSGIV